MKISYITCSLFNNFIYCDAGFDDKKYLRTSFYLHIYAIPSFEG